MTTQIDLGTGTDYIKLSSDADTVHYLSFDSGDSGITEETVDSIEGFRTGTDALILDVAGSATNFLVDVEDAADFDTLETEANASLNGTIKYVFMTDNTDGYLFVDEGTDGVADYAIEFLGVTSIAFGDILAEVPAA